MTLTNSRLVINGNETTTLQGVTRAQLTSGLSGNRLDASGFSGPVTLTAGAGNDTLIGGSGDDVLIAGTGVASMDGGGGTNTVVGRVLGRGVLANGSLDLGWGTDQVVTVAVDANVTGGTFRLSFGGQTTRDIPYNIDGAAVRSYLTELPGIGRDGVSVTQSGLGMPWHVTFRGPLGGQALPNLTVDGSGLTGTGGVSSTITTPGVASVNTLANVQLARLNAVGGDTRIDASAFSGNATLLGGLGNDTLIGGRGTNLVQGGTGDDRITSNGINDTLVGSGGIDTLVAQADGNITLTDDTLTIQPAGGGSPRVATISGFQCAELTGGSSNGVLDARNFTGVYTTTQLPSLNGGNGVGRSGGTSFSMAGVTETTPLSVLNNGAGVRTSGGVDFSITLTDGTVFPVSLAGAVTVLDALRAIGKATSGRLTINVNDAGVALVLADARPGPGTLTVTPLNGSPAAADLGLTVSSSGGILTGDPITDNAADLRIRLTNGTGIDVSLQAAATIQDVLDAINNASPFLLATFNAASSSIALWTAPPGPAGCRCRP